MGSDLESCNESPDRFGWSADYRTFRTIVTDNFDIGRANIPSVFALQANDRHGFTHRAGFDQSKSPEISGENYLPGCQATVCVGTSELSDRVTDNIVRHDANVSQKIDETDL